VVVVGSATRARALLAGPPAAPDAHAAGASKAAAPPDRRAPKAPAVVGTEWIQACADAGQLLPTGAYEQALASAAAAAAAAATAREAAAEGQGPLGRYK
jgi:hypothetical protein